MIHDTKSERNINHSSGQWLPLTV